MRINTRLMLLALILTLATSMLILPLLHTKASQASQNQQARHTIENYDIRDSHSKEAQINSERYRQKLKPEQQKKAETAGKKIKDAKEKLGKNNPDLEVLLGDTGLPELVGIKVGKRKFLTNPSNDKHENTLRNFIIRNADVYGLTTREAAQLKKGSDYTNPSGNLSWVSLQQEINGIPVFQGELVAAFTNRGELVRTVGRLAAGLEDEQGTNTQSFTTQAATPLISAAEAVAIAAESFGVTVDPQSLVIKEQSADGQTIIFEAGPFANDIKVEQAYFPFEPGVVSLAWSMVLWQDVPAYYSLVDAEKGDLLFRKNITNEQTQTATYSFYNNDSPGPLSPSTSLPGAPVQGAAIGRTIITLISEHPLGDPWLNDGDNTTTGNNVDAGMDLVAPNGIDAGSRPIGAPLRVFDFPYNPSPGIPPPGDAPTLANYRFGEAVNMFVWTNRYHDRLYELGFTEAARNFQQNNFGRGGVGNDRVLAEGQDFSGTNNANFSTSPDGTPGRMQMYIFTGTTPDRTSGLDQDVLLHELTHGTSNRLHANAGGLNFAQGGGMGEGWSDFYARALVATADEDVNGIYAAGGYSTQLIVAGYQDNYYYGIRRFPYAVKTNVGANGKPHNPLTLADVDASKINLTDGAFPRGPIGSATAHAVHNVGEVWCMALLEVRARLITRLGFAAGNQRMLQLVTDGMKLDPADPTLLDGRNSILAASAASGGDAAEENDIWAGFASRGFGFGATVSAASSAPITVTESFETPNLQLGAVTVSNDSCDNAGTADPGETLTLNIPLTNPLSATAMNATAAVVGGGSANYGNIGPGATVTRGISFTVPANVDCGSLLTVTVNIDSSFGPVTKTFQLQIGTPTGVIPAGTFSTGNISTPLPDISTTEIPIVVTSSGAVGDVNVKVRLNHTFDGDLEIRLVSPDGTAVLLSDNRGGSGDNYGSGANDCSGNPTVFDDSAANPISAGVAPFAGTFRPDAPLSGFNGKEMNGTWKLRVTDTANLDVGTVFCVQIELQQQLFFCCGVAGTPVIQAAPPATLVAECGLPANGAPDPGEKVTMSFPMKNVGSDFTTNLVATLLPGGGVVSPSGPQSYGVLSPIGPPVARDFTFYAQGTCGTDITATFHLQDGALDLGTVTFTIRIGATVVGGANGANATNIAIPATGTSGVSSPYPSSINISGVIGTVTKVTARIINFNHTFPGDVDILLVGPGGQSVVLMSDLGGTTDAVNVSITFDDAGPAIGTTVVSGTFRPTNSGTGDAFPAPAPPLPHGTALSVFNGVNPNGNWNLFVVDDAGADSGSIAGGWSLSIVTADPSCVTIPPPNVTNESVDKSSLWPPNHTMRDVTVSYNSGTPCADCTLSVASNEPVNGTGDGDTMPDWEVVDSNHVKLRAERAATGTGRIYTITITCANPATGASSTKTVEVHVAHNISSPSAGSSFKINTPVSFEGTFWDSPGKTHTAQWSFDGLSTPGVVTEPSGSRSGTVRGTYTFKEPGVYKVKLNITDNKGVTSYVTTAGQYEAIVVIYDPSGGYTYGGGWLFTPVGSFPANSLLSGNVSFGFSTKYFKNATNPKGEVQMNFTFGNLDFNALNFDYLTISGAKAQFKGFGKLNGDAGYNFILTVIDGQATGGGGVDLFRLKIWNKVTGVVAYDSQFGASDADNPTTAVGAGSTIVIVK